MISACILIRTASGKFDKVVEEMEQFHGVKKVFAVLGRYDVVVDLEAEDFVKLGEISLRMGRMAGVVFIETLIQAPLEE